MADKLDFTQLNMNLRWQKKCNDDLIIIENNDSSLNVAKAPESSNQQSADVRIIKKIVNPSEVATKGRKKFVRKKNFTGLNSKRNRPNI